VGRRQSSVCQLPASHPGFCLPAVVHHHPFNRLSPHSVHDPVRSTRQLHHDPAVTKLWRVPVVAGQRGISTRLHLRQQFWGHLVWRWLCCDNWWRWSYVVTAGVEYRTTSCSGVTGIIIVVIPVIVIVGYVQSSGLSNLVGRQDVDWIWNNISTNSTVPLDRIPCHITKLPLVYCPVDDMLFKVCREICCSGMSSRWCCHGSHAAGSKPI